MTTRFSGNSSKQHHFRGQLSLFALAALALSLFSVLLTPGSTTNWEMKVLRVPSADKLGINYYHESMGYLKRTPAEIVRDLREIRTVTTHVKIYHNPLVPTSLALAQFIVQQAREIGLSVVWTENDDNVTLTDANWPEYARSVIADAAVAYSAGAVEFLVGNEISNHNNGDPGYNDTNLPTRIKQLANDSSGNFPGPRGYEEGWYKSPSWQAAGLGSLSHLYFTLYEPWYRFKTAFDGIASTFGTRAEIGELSTMTTQNELHYTEEEWTRELLRRYDYATQKGLVAWLFTFDDFANDGFGLFYADPHTPHAIWDYLLGKKIMSYHDIPFTFEGPSLTGSLNARSAQQNRIRVGDFTDPVLAHIPLTDYVFRGVVKPISTSGAEKWRAIRLVFRYRDLGNYYFVNIEPNDNKVQLYRRTNAVETSMDEIATPVHIGSEYGFELRVSDTATGTHIQLFWDTTKIIDKTDTQHITTTTDAVGMQNNGATGEMSDIVITDFERTT